MKKLLYWGLISKNKFSEIIESRKYKDSIQNSSSLKPINSRYKSVSHQNDDILTETMPSLDYQTVKVNNKGSIDLKKGSLDFQNTSKQ